MTGFLTTIFKPATTTTTTTTAQPMANALPLDNHIPWEEAKLILSNGAGGIRVTPASAMTYSAVLACVRVLAETLASVPLIVYSRQGRRKERAKDFYLYHLLHDQPNPRLTSFEFRELLQVWLLLWGNAYCEIEYNGAGQIVALWPLLPWRMEGIKNDGGTLFYRYRDEGDRTVSIPSWRIWHLRGVSFNGVIGLAINDVARDPVALGQAAEKFGASFFNNGAMPSGVLEHPGALGDKAYDHLRDTWMAAHGGLDRAQRMAILEEGMKYSAIGVPPEQAQFLETRKYQRSEVAGIMRVPPHMIGDLENATFSNIEHQQIAFLVHSMTPWFVRWEQSIQSNLMTTAEVAQYFTRFLVEGLLRGDIASRYQAYAIGRQWGWLSADDVREKEEMNPLPNGQGATYLTPMNMTPADGDGGRAALAHNPHYHMLAEEAAGRVVRKELAAMRKASERSAGREEWATAVVDFYDGHADYVATTMRMSLAAAVDYCNQGKKELLAGGYAAAVDWLPRRVMALAAAALVVAYE